MYENNSGSPKSKSDVTKM